MLLFGKFSVLCFLVIPVVIFALLPFSVLRCAKQCCEASLLKSHFFWYISTEDEVYIGFKPTTLLKRRLRHRCSPVNVYLKKTQLRATAFVQVSLLFLYTTKHQKVRGFLFSGGLKREDLFTLGLFAK